MGPTPDPTTRKKTHAVPGTPTPARGLRRVELATPHPEPLAEFYATLLGWILIAEPDGAFTGWVGDRLATRIHPGDTGWHIVLAGPTPRHLTDHTTTDQGRALHGPWAPPPRTGEPCWIEHHSTTDDDWTTQLGWHTRHPDADHTPYDTTGDNPRPIAGRNTTTHNGWTCYFAVPDTTTATHTAKELGATIHTGPTHTPTGTTATLTDPAGHPFALLENPTRWGGTWATD